MDSWLFLFKSIWLVAGKVFSKLEGHFGKIFDGLHILYKSWSFIDDANDPLYSFWYILTCRIFKDVFHNLCENLIVRLMGLVSSIEGFSPKGNQFIDNFHDIFGIISIFPMGDIDIIIS